jgi:hypothetical protein
MVINYPNMKHKLFIGSSVEGLEFARALQRNLAYDAHVRVWDQGIFRAGNYTLEALLKALSDNDFGAFIFLPEDISIIRGVRGPVVRDNLIFELGLFIGRLGRARAFFLKPQGSELHLPTDLKGINACEFDIEDPNPISGMGSAAGEVRDLMREVHAAESAGPSRPVRAAYDRQAVLNELLRTNNPPPLVRGRKYTRNDVVTVHGDVRILEKWEDVVSYNGQPVSEIRLGFNSRSGRQADCKCESPTPNQSVFWKWIPTNKEMAESTLVFDPPLTTVPITFRTERYVFNGVAFSQADRIEFTGGKDVEEEFRVSYRHLWDACVFQIRFPEHRFPNRFRVSAFSRNGDELMDERDFMEKGLDLLPETQNLFLRIEHPLPGIKYQINWQLPEGNSSLFSDVEQGFVDEVTRRLLGLRAVNQRPTELSNALRDARRRLVNLAQGSQTESIQVALYVYDRQKAGLVCVSTLDADLIEANWTKYFFKPGRGVVGTAFRKRASVVYIRSEWKPELDVYEPVIEGDEQVRPHAILCVPLFYCGHTDRTLATLSFECQSANSTLLPCFAGANCTDRIQSEFEGWYSSTLARGVGLSSTHKYWRAEAD